MCGRGEGGGAFCSVCIFHNQKMHFYLILFVLYLSCRKNENKQKEAEFGQFFKI